MTVMMIGVNYEAILSKKNVFSWASDGLRWPPVASLKPMGEICATITETRQHCFEKPGTPGLCQKHFRVLVLSEPLARES